MSEIANRFIIYHNKPTILSKDKSNFRLSVDLLSGEKKNLSTKLLDKNMKLKRILKAAEHCSLHFLEK